MILTEKKRTSHEQKIQIMSEEEKTRIQDCLEEESIQTKRKDDQSRPQAFKKTKLFQSKPYGKEQS